MFAGCVESNALNQTTISKNLKPVGGEWLIDAEGCEPELLSSIATLRAVCERVIRELNLVVIDEGIWHHFSQPGGVTGVYLLTESHLACHTYPENGVATFNLYCCRPRPAWPWETRLIEMLAASRVSVRFAERGGVADAETDRRLLAAARSLGNEE